MTATYFILQPDGTQTGPVPQAQVLAYLRSGVLRKESLVRRADLAEFFAVESYPEFTQAAAAAAPSAVARGAVKSGVVRPGMRAGARKQEESGGGPLLWGMVIFLLALLAWGGKLGWDAWQENAVAKRAAAAEKWKSENLPEYRVVGAEKDTGLSNERETEIVIEGAVEEVAPKISAEFGRSERPEVYVRLALKVDLHEITDLKFDVETVRIREGKGKFTVRKYFPTPLVAEKLALVWDRLKVSAEVKYEK